MVPRPNPRAPAHGAAASRRATPPSRQCENTTRRLRSRQAVACGHGIRPAPSACRCRSGPQSGTCADQGPCADPRGYVAPAPSPALAALAAARRPPHLHRRPPRRRPRPGHRPAAGGACQPDDHGTLRPPRRPGARARHRRPALPPAGRARRRGVAAPLARRHVAARGRGIATGQPDGGQRPIGRRVDRLQARAGEPQRCSRPLPARHCTPRAPGGGAAARPVAPAEMSPGRGERGSEEAVAAPGGPRARARRAAAIADRTIVGHARVPTGRSGRSQPFVGQRQGDRDVGHMSKNAAPPGAAVDRSGRGAGGGLGARSTGGEQRAPGDTWWRTSREGTPYAQRVTTW